MLEKKNTGERRGAPSTHAPPSRYYETPRLTHLGDIQDVTRLIGGGPGEFMGQDNAMEPRPENILSS